MKRLESRTHTHTTVAASPCDPPIRVFPTLACAGRECGRAEYGMSYDNNFFVVGDCVTYVFI